MKQPFTTLARLALLALGLSTGLAARAQTYTPVTLTGFTEDLIANGTGAVSATTTSDIDGGATAPYTGYCLMAQDYVGPAGQVPNTTVYPANTYPALETGGTITSALNSAVYYQLASYSANNALRLYGAGAAGTLTFATPRTATELYVLGTSGSAASVLNVTVNFAGGTSQTFSNLTLADWFAAGQTNVVREKLGRVSRADNSVQYTSGTASVIGPRLYQLTLTLDASNLTKNITGISFTKPLAAGTTVLLGVTAASSPVCAAMPSGLAAVAAGSSGGGTITTACSATNIYLSVTGLPANTGGYAYQWQSSANGTTWADISGATGSTYVATGQTAATYYRVVVKCLYDGMGGMAVNSAAVQIAQTPASGCYCVPAAHTSTTTSYSTVTSVSLPGDAGVTLSNAPGLITSTSPGYVSDNYATYPASSTTTSLSPNTSYTLSVAVPAFTRATAWVDFNQNGSFDASEFVILQTGTAVYGTVATTLTGAIAVPATATSGSTRLRIRTDYYLNTVLNTGAGACTTTQYGQTMDYFVTITTPTACTGTPPAITLAASSAAVCGGTSFTLTATGAAAGTTGLSYQFQARVGTAAFTNQGAAQASPTYTVASQTAATDYRVIVTCTNSSLSATSNVVAVTQSPFLNCYCTPVTTGTGTDGITNVTLGTLNNSSSATNTAPYYTDYSTAQTAGNPAIPTLFVGGTASVSITMGSDPNQYSGVWIDFDHSGTFDVAEYFTLGTNAGGNGTSVIPINIPASALTGQTKMRVRGGDDVRLLETQACTAASSTSNYGEVEDYLVTIATQTACAGTPPAITATSSTAAACPNTAFTLSSTGIAAGATGLTYQWQSRVGTAAFANIAGATAATYTVPSQTAATDYRLVVTCTASTQASTSNTVTVTQSSFLGCYTLPIVSTGTNEYIRSVNVNGATGFTNATNASSANGYNDFTTNAALTTTLTKGQSYPVTVIVQSNAVGSQGALWIDFDHSSTFDAGEYFAFGSAGVSTTPVTFNYSLAIPNTAAVLTGATRMRLRWRNGPITASDAQVSGAGTWYGETEDYLVTLAAALPTKAGQAVAGLELAPNPTHAQATLTGAEAGAAVQVLDVLGRTILSARADATGKAVLTLPAGLAGGVYLVRTGQQTTRLLLE